MLFSFYGRERMDTWIRPTVVHSVFKSTFVPHGPCLLYPFLSVRFWTSLFFQVYTKLLGTSKIVVVSFLETPVDPYSPDGGRRRVMETFSTVPLTLDEVKGTVHSRNVNGQFGL